MNDGTYEKLLAGLIEEREKGGPTGVFTSARVAAILYLWPRGSIRRGTVNALFPHRQKERPSPTVRRLRAMGYSGSTVRKNVRSEKIRLRLQRFEYLNLIRRERDGFELVIVNRRRLGRIASYVDDEFELAVDFAIRCLEKKRVPYDELLVNKRREEELEAVRSLMTKPGLTQWGTFRVRALFPQGTMIEMDK